MSLHTDLASASWEGKICIFAQVCLSMGMHEWSFLGCRQTAEEPSEEEAAQGENMFF